MKKILLFTLTVLLTITAQGQTTLTNETIQKKIEEFYPQTPDSSIYYLKASLKTIPKANDSLLVENLIKLGLSFALQQKKDSTHFYLEKAISSAKKDLILKGTAYQQWGRAHRDFGEYERANSLLTIADSLFHEANHLPGTGMVLVQRATINHYTQNIKTAIEQLQEAIGIFEETDHQQFLQIAQMELAAVYLMSGDYAFAKELYAQLLPAFEKDKEINYYILLTNYGDTNFQLEEWEDAKKKYTTAYEYFESNHLERLQYYVLSKIAEVNLIKGDLNKSAEQFEEAYEGLLQQNSPRLQQVATSYISVLRESGDSEKALLVLESVIEKSSIYITKLNTNNDIYFLEQASKVYKDNNQYADALQATEKIIHLKDSLNEANNRAITKELEAKYQNQYFHQKTETLNAEKELFTEKTKRNRIIIGSLGVILLLVTISGSMIYKKNQEKIAFKNKGLKESAKKVKALKEKNELQKQLIEERQENINIKNREMVSLSLQLADINNQIEGILQNGTTEHIHPVVSNKLKSILRNENYWKLFHKRFNEVHPDFEQEIKESFPQFNHNNIEFCKLLKLKMDNKEIAKLFGISPQSVITRKYRLRKKLKSEKEEFLLDKILS